MGSIFGRGIIVTKTNTSGGPLAKGDVVIVDAANDNAVTTTTSAASTVTVGVVVEENGIASNLVGKVQFGGHVALVNVNAAVTRGHYGKTHTVAKQATDAGASRAVGAFCVFSTGGTTPEADLFSQPDATAGSGSVATDTIWDAAGDLAQGTGADAAAKLSAVATGKVLASKGVGVAVAWDYPPFHGCKAYSAAAQGINNTSAAAILELEDFDTDAYHFLSAANLTGTVAKTATSADIVGTSTSFTTELSVNQVISIPGTATEIGVVKTITDNTHVTLWQTMANTASGQTAARLNSVMAIPAGMGGYYRLNGGTASSAAGGLWVGFVVNGTNLRGFSAFDNAVASYGQCTSVAALVPGDYIQMKIATSANINVGNGGGGTANQTWMAIELAGI